MPEQLPEITAGIREKIEDLHAARERALANGRQIIQLSSRTIKHIHRQQMAEAEKLLVELRQLVESSAEPLAAFPTIRHAPYFQDAVKEYIEALTLRAIIQEQPLPMPADLGVEPQAYLHGLCEAASECRRYALDEMRRGRTENAFRLANEMEDIYDELVTFDYPDALMSNLRRSVDALRAVLERTQSDLAVTVTQLELIDELKKARGEA